MNLIPRRLTRVVGYVLKTMHVWLPIAVAFGLGALAGHFLP